MTDTAIDPQVGKEFIEHFGTKGMKWGVRRSQAELGKGKAKKEGDSKPRKAAPTEKRIVGKTRTTGKDPANLSDAQLQKLNNRLNMEQQYAKLTKPSPTRTRRVLNSVGKFGAEAGRGIAMQQVKSLGNEVAAPQTARIAAMLAKKMAK